MKALIFLMLVATWLPAHAASYTIWTCSAGGSKVNEITPANTQRPACPTSNGSYQTVEIYDPTATTAPTVAQQLELIGVNAPSIAKTFIFGFVTYLSFWGLSFGAQAALKAIKTA